MEKNIVFATKNLHIFIDSSSFQLFPVLPTPVGKKWGIQELSICL